MKVRTFLDEVRATKVLVWCRCQLGESRQCAGCTVANAVHQHAGMPALAFLKMFERHSLKAQTALPVLTEIVEVLVDMGRTATNDDTFGAELMAADLSELAPLLQRRAEKATTQ